MKKKKILFQFNLFDKHAYLHSSLKIDKYMCVFFLLFPFTVPVPDFVQNAVGVFDKTIKIK
jgi:hypothetical protein